MRAHSFDCSTSHQLSRSDPGRFPFLHFCAARRIRCAWHGLECQQSAVSCDGSEQPAVTRWLTAQYVACVLIVSSPFHSFSLSISISACIGIKSDKCHACRRLSSLPRPGVFEWLEGLPGFDKHTFTRERLAAQALGDRFARDDSFREAYRLFEEHIDHGEKKLLRKVIRPSLMSTMGAPGSGKSFLLDELAEFHPKDVTEFASVERREYFHESNVLALNVTFNSDTPFTASLESSAEQSLCLRILFQYVILLCFLHLVCVTAVASDSVLKMRNMIRCFCVPLSQVFPGFGCPHGVSCILPIGQALF